MSELFSCIVHTLHIGQLQKCQTLHGYNIFRFLGISKYMRRGLLCNRNTAESELFDVDEILTNFPKLL